MENVRILKPKEVKHGKQLLSIYIEQLLNDIYHCEKAVIVYYSDLLQHSFSQVLSDTLTEIIRITELQIRRIDLLMSDCSIERVTKRKLSIDDIAREGIKVLEGFEEGMVSDAAIIMASQKIKHYELALYSTLLSIARQSGKERIASLAEETLSEEKEGDRMLSRIAEVSINMSAAETEERELLVIE